MKKDKDSPGYKVSVRYFSSGSCEEFLTFETDLKRVFKGQDITSGAAQFEVTRRLLTGGALTTFNQALAAGEAESTANWKVCMDAVRESVFPKHANVLQRRLMRHGNLRKPMDMSIRQFVDRMRELNSYLTRFPPVSSTAPAKELDAEEFIDALQQSIPNSWNAQMSYLGFSPLENSMELFVKKCQDIEEMERSKRKNGGTGKSANGNAKKQKKELNAFHQLNLSSDSDDSSVASERSPIDTPSSSSDEE